MRVGKWLQIARGGKAAKRKCQNLARPATTKKHKIFSVFSVCFFPWHFFAPEE